MAKQDLEAIHSCILDRILSWVRDRQRWLGHNVKVADETGVRLPDTPQNQAEFLQSGEQREGCGFPVMQLVGCFCLAIGVIIDWVETALKSHEYRIFRHMLHLFTKEDAVLGDRGFCSYANLAMLLERGAHAVMRTHQRRMLDYREGKRLGPLDRLIT
jgi:hypothetical protein